MEVRQPFLRHQGVYSEEHHRGQRSGLPAFVGHRAAGAAVGCAACRDAGLGIVLGPERLPDQNPEAPWPDRGRGSAAGNT